MRRCGFISTIYINVFLAIWSRCYYASLTGEPQVIGSSQPILARVGDDVILPCHVEPPDNMEKMTVEWSRPDLEPAYVYLLQDGRYVTDIQNPLYKQRASLFHEQLSHGNISLKLTRVMLSDEGTYKCFVPNLRSNSLIQLLVGAVSQPVISSNGPTDDGLSLTCDSGCWYPEPEISWLDGDGNLLPAGPSVTQQRSQHCYAVQRNVTRTTDLTCRVHLPHINHTVNIQRYIPEDMIPTQGGLTGGAITGIVGAVFYSIIILVAVGLLCVAVGYLWKTGRSPASKRYHLADQMDFSSTSPKPRPWKRISKRWREQLQKLANIDDCKFIKVGSFVFGNNSEFLIGTGSNGTYVFLGLRNDGTEVAVKRMTKINFQALKNEKYFLRLLSKLDDPSIVQYVDYAEDENFCYLALQLCEYTLEEYITKHNPSEMERKDLAHQVLKSLIVLHGQNPLILHRDIKPQNIFIDSEGKARLADFGISRELKEGKTTKYTSPAGTSSWMAKETLVKRGHGPVPYTRSSDIQVAGMLIYYILSGGDHPFGDDCSCEVNIRDGRYSLDRVQDEVAKDLIKKMINADPKKRPTVEDCLDHPLWLDQPFLSNQSTFVVHAGEGRLDPHLTKGSLTGTVTGGMAKLGAAVGLAARTVIGAVTGGVARLGAALGLAARRSRDQKDGTTSPKPRKWNPASGRWRQQYKKLANIDDREVIRVGRFLFGKHRKFLIGTGNNGTVVFLGLTDDGTEVAVKRMGIFNYEELKYDEGSDQLVNPSIVQYVDREKDELFGYLVLQLCEYNLETCINEHNLSEMQRKPLAKQVLQSLSVLHCQNPPILHRDIKPQNVLIDTDGKARLADFGIIQPPERRTHTTGEGAGKQCWMAKETVIGDKDKTNPDKGPETPVMDDTYTRSSDIQVAGMLIYYILSGGHHPFAQSFRCESNIYEGIYNLDLVRDEDAKHLIEWMINADPEKRPTVEKCLAHPFFWSNQRRVEYLIRIENEEEVVSCPDDDLIRALDQYAEQGQFNSWKHKFPSELVQKMDGLKSYPENSFGLLHFMHDLHEHHAEDAAHIDLVEMFPGLVGDKFAQEQDWNSSTQREDVSSV